MWYVCTHTDFTLTSDSFFTYSSWFHAVIHSLVLQISFGTGWGTDKYYFHVSQIHTLYGQGYDFAPHDDKMLTVHKYKWINPIYFGNTYRDPRKPAWKTTQLGTAPGHGRTPHSSASLQEQDSLGSTPTQTTPTVRWPHTLSHGFWITVGTIQMKSYRSRDIKNPFRPLQKATRRKFVS